MALGELAQGGKMRATGLGVFGRGRHRHQPQHLDRAAIQERRELTWGDPALARLSRDIDLDEDPGAGAAVTRELDEHRRVVRDTWLLSSIVEVHSGFPYSAVTDTLDWAGARNLDYHFPTVRLVDVDIERKVKFFKWRPFVGLRVYNLLNSFVPTEVQANLSSAAFGSFYNSQPRRFRVQVNFFK